MEHSRMGALTPAETALLGAVEEAYDHLPMDGVDDARLHEMIARVADSLLSDVAPPVDDWAKGTPLVPTSQRTPGGLWI